jgi:transcriptional regulator with XRE-family HTH domain
MDLLIAVAKSKQSVNPIGRRVAALRRGKHTQAELAAIVGIHKASLARLETNPDVNPSLELIQKLAGALGVTVAELVSEVPVIPSKN